MSDISVKKHLNPHVMREAYSQVSIDKPTPFTDTFFTNPENVDDDEFTFFYDPADEIPAPMNVPGGSARVVTVGSSKERKMTCFTIFNVQEFKSDLYKALREPSSYQLQDKGRAEIGRLTKKFAARHRLAKELVIAKALADGVVYMNASGEILESSSGAEVTADFEIPANNQGTANGLNPDLWSEADTDIPSVLEAISEQAASDIVPRPTEAWVPYSALQYLRNNDTFIEWAAKNPEYSSKILRGEPILDLWGFNWHFVMDYYTAADGSRKPLVPATKAILTPPPGDSWRVAVNGPTVVPSLDGITGSVEEAIGKQNIVHGPFSYAKIEDNPVRISNFAGDKFGFGFNEPGAVWQLTAFPS